MGEIVFRIEVELDFPFGRRPPQVVRPLCQVAIKECAEPSRRTKLQRAMVARLRFDSPARELIGTWRNYNTRGDLEGCHKRFPMGFPGKLETISRLQFYVDR